MALDGYWFDRPDIDKFVEALEKLGFDWEIVDLETKPTMRIWKPFSQEGSYDKTESLQR